MALTADHPDTPKIDPARCSGCGRCVAACPLRLISLEVSGFRKNAVLGTPCLCSRCGQCVTSCPLKAIVSSSESRSEEH